MVFAAGAWRTARACLGGSRRHLLRKTAKLPFLRDVGRGFIKVTLPRRAAAAREPMASVGIFAKGEIPVARQAHGAKGGALRKMD